MWEKLKTHKIGLLNGLLKAALYSASKYVAE